MQFKQIGIILGAGGLLMFAAFQDQPEVQSTHATDERTVVAAPAMGAGFALPTPQGFSSTDEVGGITFVQDGQIRTPLMVRITLQRNADVPMDDERTLADGVARFQIEELEGGSAGPLWQLSAARDTDKGVLVMRASQQAELGPPSFAKAWEIFESIDVTH